MSTCVHQSMTIHHESGVMGRLFARLRLWRKRSRDRAALARLTERDLHDVGLSLTDVLYEAEKPFWRA